MKTLPKQKPKHETDENGPLRRCIATGEILSPERLIRFVVSPDGVLTPDLGAELPGRGIWLTANREILDKTIAGKGFTKAARRQISLPPDLTEMVAGLLLRRVMQILGFARKAGDAICGREKVEAQLRSGKIGVLIGACDGAEDGKSKLHRLALAVSPDVFYVTCLNTTELSLAFGRDNVIHAAIAHGRLSDRFRVEAARLLGFRGKSG